MPVRILVADKLAQSGVEALSRHHDVDVKTGLSKDELLAIVASYEAIVVRSATTIDADVIAAATNLRVVGRAGVGLDNVDVDAATRAGVIVCNAPQSNIVSAAEHTMAMILSVARNVPQAHAALKAGSWERSKWNGTELHGKVLGILGLGRIGTLVAQRASAFGMQLHAYDPFIAPERAARMNVTLHDTVEGVLRVADVLTIHLPRNAETTGLLDADRLAMMKSSALLVNVARGGIVVEDDLAAAVAAGTIAGAGIDVFATEPTTASPLFDHPGIIVTPHLGASTEEAQDKAGTQVADAIELALAGEFVPSAVNVQGGPVDDIVKPFLPLGERLGKLLARLAQGGLSEVAVEYQGELAGVDCRVLGLSVLKGLLASTVAEPVTFVNAPLLAEDRGLQLREVLEPHSRDYVSLLRVSGVRADGEVVRVAGAIMPGERERLVEVWNTAIDVEPSAHMAFFRYTDRPGVVGTVGTMLGEAGVNIGTADVGRAEAGGEAIMALSLDDIAADDVVARIVAEIGATEGGSVHLH
jgi:D-3-phosphoglycerate dehydrogenase